MSSNVQYITDANGERTAVILPLDEYQELLEDMHLIRVAEESKDEPRIPWEQVKAELADEGKLDAAEWSLRSKFNLTSPPRNRKAWPSDSGPNCQSYW